MTESGTQSVFISYSRADMSSVKPLVDLLRASNVSVFLDIENIPYGEDWASLIEQKIRSAGRVLVFWSKNAATSDYVRREYLEALKLSDIRVIPVPLDDTLLPPELSRLQGLTDIGPLLNRAKRTSSIIRFFPRKWPMLVAGTSLGVGVFLVGIWPPIREAIMVRLNSLFAAEGDDLSRPFDFPGSFDFPSLGELLKTHPFWVVAFALASVWFIATVILRLREKRIAEALNRAIFQEELPSWHLTSSDSANP